MGMFPFLCLYLHFLTSRSYSLLAPLLRVFHDLPPTSPCPVTSPLTHVIHSLITIPVTPTLRPTWLGPPDALQHAYDLLKVSLSRYFPGKTDPDDSDVRTRCKAESSDTLDDMLSPLVVLITKLCLADEGSRTRVRHWIVPEDLDRSSPLEERSDILGRCLRLLSCVYHSRLKDSIGELLFAVADSDGGNFILFYCDSIQI